MGSKPVGISASRGAAFLGVSRYKTPVAAWCEIMEERKPGFCAANGFLTPVKSDPFAEPLDPKLASLRWGLAFEPAICSIGGVTKDFERAYVHPENDFLTCHIDGRDDDGVYQENKTVFDMAFKSGWGEPGTELIPVEYQVQFQHAAMCTGDKVGRLNALVFPKAPAEFEKAGFRIEKNDISGIWTIFHEKSVVSIPCEKWALAFQMIGNFHRYNLVANTAAQKEMLERYLYIWNHDILGEVPPPAQGYDDIKWLFNAPEGEIEATDEIRELWQEHIDIGNEIESMILRQGEIKNIFSYFAAIQLKKKLIRAGGEPKKLNVYAGQRKLFTISKPEPGAKVSRSSTERVAEEMPELYEEMKATTFADILGDVDLTDKQAETVKEIDSQIDKFLGKKKLSAILSRESIIKAIERTKPELYRKMVECSIIEMTEPTARLTIKKPEE